VIVVTPKDGIMITLPLWIFVPAGLYACLGILILRRALRPSCRECVHRDRCPNRPRGRFQQTPFCLRQPSRGDSGPSTPAPR
jgi:hypothetical protein